MQRKGLKKVETAIYQTLERVRDEEAAGSNPVIPTTLNLSNQAVSEVFDLLENMYFLNLTTCVFDSNSGVNFRPVEFISHMQN